MAIDRRYAAFRIPCLDGVTLVLEIVAPSVDGILREVMLHEAGLFVCHVLIHAQISDKERAECPVAAPYTSSILTALGGERHAAIAGLLDHSGIPKRRQCLAHAGLRHAEQIRNVDRAHTSRAPSGSSCAKRYIASK